MPINQTINNFNKIYGKFDFIKIGKYYIDDINNLEFVLYKVLFENIKTFLIIAWISLTLRQLIKLIFRKEIIISFIDLDNYFKLKTWKQIFKKEKDIKEFIIFKKIELLKEIENFMYILIILRCVLLFQIMYL